MSVLSSIFKELGATTDMYYIKLADQPNNSSFGEIPYFLQICHVLIWCTH